jgi:hypothetical protein
MIEATIRKLPIIVPTAPLRTKSENRDAIRRRISAQRIILIKNGRWVGRKSDTVKAENVKS